MNETLQPFEIQREALAEKLRLKSQWEAQVKALNETGVLEILPEAQDIGIVGIDGKEYPVPKYEEILQKITPEKIAFLEEKLEQGLESDLVLEPVAMPLEVLIDRYKRELLKHYQEGTLSAADGSKLDLNINDPIYVWNGFKGADKNGQLVYDPKRFDKENHEGKTKQETIERIGGWRVRLVRKEQLKANQSSRDYLKLTQEDPQYQGEQGLTPEAEIAYALTKLHQENMVIDDYQGEGKGCRLFGAFLPSSGEVPLFYWNRDNAQAELNGYHSDIASPDVGARSSVEI